MLDEKGKQTLFQEIHDLWIQPELERRFAETSTPNDFKIWEALIKLPYDCPPIVEFNNEIEWVLTFKVAKDVEVESGQTVYLHEVENIEQAMPPMVDDKRVAFIYLFWAGYSYRIILDFTPNDSEFDASSNDFTHGKAIADHLRAKLIETTIRLSRNAAQQLRQIGLWSATCLLPYPLSRILERIAEDKLDQATDILVEHCNPDFIQQLVETWKPITAFNDRIDVFREASFAHGNHKFRLSIYSLIPQIEGIITDWLYPIVYPPLSTQDWSTKTRIAQFEAEMQKIPEFEFSYREALISVVEFLKHGQPLQRFKNWLDTIDTNFPARHALSHGKYMTSMFSEENSIKLFLLLDTICQFMMFYEVRVLGKKLSGDTEAE
jgi:hypothetical protein